MLKYIEFQLFWRVGRIIFKLIFFRKLSLYTEVVHILLRPSLALRYAGRHFGMIFRCFWCKKMTLALESAWLFKLCVFSGQANGATRDRFWHFTAARPTPFWECKKKKNTWQNCELVELSSRSLTNFWFTNADHVLRSHLVPTMISFVF